MTMTFTDSGEPHRQILANPYLPEHLRERAKNDTSEYCRAEDDDDLLEIDRLAGHGLVRFHFESGNASMRMLAPKLPAGASPVLHSDMGWQYRHPWWRDRLGELGIRQSMSRKGNCLDNAATEQVFGHLKDEFYRDREFDSYERFKAELDDYIIHWNTKRRQIRLGGHTPEEFRRASTVV